MCHFGKHFAEMKDTVQPLDMEWTREKRIRDRSTVVDEAAAEEVKPNFIMRKQRKKAVSQ